jgi:hypothetical protein
VLFTPFCLPSTDRELLPLLTEVVEKTGIGCIEQLKLAEFLADGHFPAPKTYVVTTTTSAVSAASKLLAGFPGFNCKDAVTGDDRAAAVSFFHNKDLAACGFAFIQRTSATAAAIDDCAHKLTRTQLPQAVNVLFVGETSFDRKEEALAFANGGTASDEVLAVLRESGVLRFFQTSHTVSRTTVSLAQRMVPHDTPSNRDLVCFVAATFESLVRKTSGIPTSGPDGGSLAVTLLQSLADSVQASVFPSLESVTSAATALQWLVSVSENRVDSPFALHLRSLLEKGNGVCVCVCVCVCLCLCV